MIDDFRYGQVGLAEEKRKEQMEKEHSDSQPNDGKEEISENSGGFFSRFFTKKNKTRKDTND